MAPTLFFGVIVVFSVINITLQNELENVIDAKNETFTLTNAIKSKSIYDYQTRVVAYKDVTGSRCLLEFLNTNENVQNNNISKNSRSINEKNVYMSNQLSKRQIYRFAGPRISDFCHGFPTYLIKQIMQNDENVNENYMNDEDLSMKRVRINKRSTRHFFVGRVRGQTQSQYLNFGKGSEAGTAEAESSSSGSKAVVSGSSGMGQAQSQSIPIDCDECYGGASDIDGEHGRQVDQGLHYGQTGVGEQRVPEGDHGRGFGIGVDGGRGTGVDRGRGIGSRVEQGNRYGPSVDQGRHTGTVIDQGIGGGGGIDHGRGFGTGIDHGRESGIGIDQGRGGGTTGTDQGRIHGGGREQGRAPGETIGRGRESAGGGGTATYPVHSGESRYPLTRPDYGGEGISGRQPTNTQIIGQSPAQTDHSYIGQGPIGVGEYYGSQPKPGAAYGGHLSPSGIPGGRIPIDPSVTGHEYVPGQTIYGETPGRGTEGSSGRGPAHPISTYKPSGGGTVPGGPSGIPSSHKQYPIPPGYKPGQRVDGNLGQQLTGDERQHIGNVPTYPSGTHEGKFHGQLSGTYGPESGNEDGRFAGVFSGRYEGTYGHYAPQRPSYIEDSQSGQNVVGRDRGIYAPGGTATYQRPGVQDGQVYERPGLIQTPTGTAGRPGVGRPTQVGGERYQPDTVPGVSGQTVYPSLSGTGRETYYAPEGYPSGHPTYQRPGVGAQSYGRPGETAGTIYQRPGQSGTGVYESPGGGVGTYQQPGSGSQTQYTPTDETSGTFYRPGTGVHQAPYRPGGESVGVYQEPTGGVTQTRPGTGDVETYYRPGEEAIGSYQRPGSDGRFQGPGSETGIQSRPVEGHGGTQGRPEGGIYGRPSIPGEYSRPSTDGLYTEPGEQRPSPYGKLGEQQGGQGLDDDSDSQVQTSVQQDLNGTQANAQAQGIYGGGTAQSQVSGVYSGSGSFSASAGSDDGKRGAQTQVSGGKNGAQSSAQGRGGVGQSQAQVVLSSATGDTMSSSQTSGDNHGTQTLVRASNKGGMADAQSNGLGSTSSQAQIGFTPYDENEQDEQNTPFRGGGTASAQGGARRGMTQSQIQGKFRKGIKYVGAAQAGSGGNFNKTALNGFAPIIPLKFETADTPNKNKSIDIAVAGNSKSVNMQLIKEDDTTQVPEDYKDDDYDESEYDDATERAPPKSRSIIAQKTKTQHQQIVLDPLEDLDATVYQSKSGFPEHGAILQPGELIPGSPGYQIPLGFRGRVKSIANGPNTFTIGKNSQAQSVQLTPGTGRIIYKTPVYTVTSNTVQRNGQYGYGSGYTYQPVQYQIKSGKPLPNFVSVTKSETGSTDLTTGEKTPNVYYSQSSTCGVFTNTCVFNATGRLCFPKLKTNDDGTVMGC